MQSIEAPKRNAKRARDVVLAETQSLARGRPSQAVPLKPLRGDRGWTTAATFVMTVVLGYGLWYGGHIDEMYADISDRGAQLAVESGFGVQRLTVDGQRRTADADIVKALEMNEKVSLFGYDTNAARARLEQLPWVKRAQVMRLLPSTVHVALQEREPYAVWQIGGKTHLIDDTGAVVAEAERREYVNLPFVVGEGAHKTARAFMSVVAEHPSIAKHAYAAVRIADRRWTLKLASGAEVLLPEADEAAALKTLAELDRTHGVLTKPYARIDLRLSDRVTMRPSVKPVDDATAVKAAPKVQPRGPSHDT